MRCDNRKRVRTDDRKQVRSNGRKHVQVDKPVQKDLCKLDAEAATVIHEHARNWPTLPLPEVVHKCLKAYYTNTSQKRPRCCAVCACRRWNTQMHEYVISNGSCADLQGLHILCITDKYIIEHLTQNSIIPHFGNLAMDEYPLLLHSPGVHIKDKSLDAHIDVCNHCHASLKLHKVPKFSLKNHLYHGHLPDEFHDLTWVEEMAVAIYRATAYVTRLYFSDDPKNPHVFHGNTCAHEQNVVSTAKALPRTAADVSNTISVLFVGPSKDVPNKSMLKNVFCIQKAKVHSFLQWLRLNHQMYCDFDIDISALDTYEDDDALPGIENRVISDLETNRKD